MALNSINTNIAAYAAQSNIGKANNHASASIARLSSGSRIVRAADDVAALSAGTSLRTNVTTLRTAQINTSQGASLLQVADGALSQVTDILQRQKAIAVQAGAGSLTSAERGFLNQEFQNLTQEIDRLATQTNFNGVTLLDGSLFEKTVVEQATDASTSASASITFSTLANGEVVSLNGVAFTAAVATGATAFLDVATSGSVAASVQSLANVLNASTNTAISGAKYEAVNNTLIITSRSGGEEGEIYRINDTATTATATINGRQLQTAAGAALGTDTYTLQGASDTGVSRGNTFGVGTIGDTIIATQDQARANVTLNFSNVDVNADLTVDAAAGNINFDDGIGGDLLFELDTDGTAAAAGNVLVDISGIDLTSANPRAREDVLDAIVNAYNSYSGTADYVAGQLEARRDGDNIIFTKKDAGDVLNVNGVAPTQPVVTAGIANIAITGSTTLANGNNTGITTSGVTNSAFVGNIQGFSATYNGSANSVDLSVTVGDRTYTASGLNTSLGTTAAPATARLFSEEGDYFDIDLTGTTVNNQSEANTFAQRVDKAFSTITFTQDREVTSFDAAGDIYTEGVQTGSLTGSSFSLQSASGEEFVINDVRVKAPLEGQDDGVIEFDINGVTYRSEGNIGSEIGANAVALFRSQENANDVLTFRNGDTAIEFDTNAEAAALQTALTDAFGIGEGGDTIDFQVGVTTSDTLKVSIGNVTTKSIYGGQTLDVLTKETAAAASDALDAALDAVTSVRAEVGALQSRFDFASANIQSSIENQDAARGVLLDTDIAAESTAYSTSQVQLQAGIAVLAQANLLPQNLLQLIGN